jgi:hypothetical protein
MAKHNKKRNVGLIHEQLVRYVASSLIAKDKKSAAKAVKIITKHFRPGSELYKEFRLFNALVNLPVGSRDLAERVLVESKKFSVTHDANKLRQEKSLLIKDINTQLAESRRFYDIKIDNYRFYATVQTMLNEWRGKNALDMTARARYEEKIVENLSMSPDTVIEEKMETDPLVRKLMFQKFEVKYKDHLSTEQKRILEAAVLDDDVNFKATVQSIKERALRTIRKFKSTCDNETLLEKIDGVRQRIEILEETKSDSTVAKTLHLVQLLEEMEVNDER